MGPLQHRQGHAHPHCFLLTSTHAHAHLAKLLVSSPQTLPLCPFPCPPRRLPSGGRCSRRFLTSQPAACLAAYLAPQLGVTPGRVAVATQFPRKVRRGNKALVVMRIAGLLAYEACEAYDVCEAFETRTKPRLRQSSVLLLMMLMTCRVVMMNFCAAGAATACRRSSVGAGAYAPHHAAGGGAQVAGSKGKKLGRQLCGVVHLIAPCGCACGVVACAQETQVCRQRGPIFSGKQV